ncbi:hypothetical protein [Stenotrophomonas rhizophila]|uniref:hypothetical protein n=1 Tax=Stenotrophomonas rhizophila TaxID=216778 RepID=UPI001611907C|nr:hypothetical protein [Stenotrophomonas rhizophila]
MRGCLKPNNLAGRLDTLDANNKQQTTNNKQQTTNNKQQTTNSKQQNVKCEGDGAG